MGKRRKPNPSEYCIYALDNTITGKRYIGQTQDLGWRKVTHRGKLKNNKHPNSKLQEDWNKYGEKAFEYSVIEYCDRSVANEREMYYISLFDTVNKGYNISIGGTNGHNFPRRKIKQYDIEGNFIREWESAAEAARAFKANRGQITHAIIQKRLFFNCQWCYENEEINGYYLKKNQFPMAQYDLKGNLVNVYKSLASVIAQNNGFKKESISGSMDKKWRKTAYGYKWKKITKEEYYELCKQLA